MIRPRQSAAERAPSSLLAVTEPTESATAAAFAHTAVLAGRPDNIAALAQAGRLFGRLAHLLDTVEDLPADVATGAWNPLVATGTDLAGARRHADDAVLGCGSRSTTWSGPADRSSTGCSCTSWVGPSSTRSCTQAARPRTTTSSRRTRRAACSADEPPRSGWSAPARCAARTSSPARGAASRARAGASRATAVRATAAMAAPTVTVAAAATAPADPSYSLAAENRSTKGWR